MPIVGESLPPFENSGAQEPTTDVTLIRDFKLKFNALRAQAQSVAEDLISQMRNPLVIHPQTPKGVDTSEVRANIMLAYRHLEDARMRLGKAIQATEGGVSIYDRSPQPNPSYVCCQPSTPKPA